MCVKWFYGYTCGHCSIPNIERCPIVMQNPMFPTCSFPGHFGQLVPEMCHPCSRVEWNRKVLDAEAEAEHKKRHEYGMCDCGFIFSEEERQRRPEADGREGKGRAEGPINAAMNGREWGVPGPRRRAGWHSRDMYGHRKRQDGPAYLSRGHQMVDQQPVEWKYQQTGFDASRWSTTWYTEEDQNVGATFMSMTVGIEDSKKSTWPRGIYNSPFASLSPDPKELQIVEPRHGLLMNCPVAYELPSVVVTEYTSQEPAMVDIIGTPKTPTVVSNGLYLPKRRKSSPH